MTGNERDETHGEPDQPGGAVPSGSVPRRRGFDLGNPYFGEPGGVEGEEAASEFLGDARPSPSLRRRIVLRVSFLAVTAICLYLLAPSLLRVFGSVQNLARVNPLWFPLILGLQAASFVCIWYLLRIALQTRKWFVVATSQLAGNAFSRLVPAGAAAGVAMQYRMLADAGIATARAASSLTAVSLLTLAVVLSLPVLAIPAMIGGSVASGLVRAALLGGLVFVVMVVLGSTLLFSDPALRKLGSGVQWVVNTVRRHHEPTRDLPDRLTAERNQVKSSMQSQWWQALLASVGRSMFDYGSLLVALLAVGADPNPSLVLLAFVASQVLAMIPLTPGGLGFVEAGLTATLTVAGVPAPLAVVATLAYRLASYWIPMAVGMVAFVIFRSRYRYRHAADRDQAANGSAQAR
jgi:uncharacterized protein (TIRG00374 family)